MTTYSRTLRAILAAAAMGAVGACGSLDISNPNAPDRTRALAQSGDVVNLVGGAFYNWYFAMQYYTPAIATGVMASQISMSWGNFGARTYSSVPRVGFNNVATDANIDVVNSPWYGNYGALVSANLALGQVKDTSVFHKADSVNAKMVTAAAQFIQGATLSNISLLFDQGYAVDENSDPTQTKFVSHDSVRKAAIAKLNLAIASANAATFTLPKTYLNIAGWSNVQLAEVANTLAARTLAYAPRSHAEMTAVDWASVVSYASKGISGGAQPFDPSIVGDNNIWYDGYKNLGGDWDTWVRVNQRVVNELDPNQPNQYPDTRPSPIQPISPDARYDSTSRKDASAGALSPNTADYLYVTYDNFNPSRGFYHFSQVGNNRYSYHSTIAADGGGLGTVPFFIRAENDLLWAEGLVRSGGSRATAAALINKSRVNRGHLTPLTGAEVSSVGVQGLATLDSADNSDVLLRAIYYERDIELMLSSGITPFYDARRVDRYTNYFVRAPGDLANTPRQFPVPAKELETLGIQLYTFNGADSVASGVPSSSRQASFNVLSAGSVRPSAMRPPINPFWMGGRLVTGPGVILDLANKIWSSGSPSNVTKY